MLYKTVFIKGGKEKNFLEGHPWFFSGAIKSLPDNFEDGSLCRIAREDGAFLATGYYNGKADIALRVLSRREIEINEDFFAEAFRGLSATKRALLGDSSNSFRLCFGDSDGLPGLIVDCYAGVYVIQISTLGMEGLREAAVAAITKEFSPIAIYERSAVSTRRREGLKDQPSGLLYGELPKELIISENGLKFFVDVERGQKTGFYLDQRENRAAIGKYAKGKRVLNCFSYSGAFGVYAAKAGAVAVTNIDSSKAALELARKNFELNGLAADEGDFVEADVFEFLSGQKRGDFDMIILDPPSFAKNRQQLKHAINAYTTINQKALEKLPEGGVLVSCSCTGHIDELTFIKILHKASALVGCDIKLLENKSQPFDHAYNLSFPEGRYLKFFVVQKTERL